MFTKVYYIFEMFCFRVLIFFLERDNTSKPLCQAFFRKITGEILCLTKPAPITSHRTPPVVPCCSTAAKEASGFLTDKAHSHVTTMELNLEKIPWCFRFAWLFLPVSNSGHWHRYHWVTTAVKDSECLGSVYVWCWNCSLKVDIKL